MTPVQIFMLGWQEYEKKKQILRLLTPFADHAHLVPPTEAEIKKILIDNEPVAPVPMLKEWSIG